MLLVVVLLANQITPNLEPELAAAMPFAIDNRAYHLLGNLEVNNEVLP
jgi:hypothetical protein